MKSIPQLFFCFVMSFFFLFDNLIYSQQWDTLASIPESLTFPVVGVLDGKIHVMGGGGSGGATSAHYAYDPLTDSWESKAPVPYLAQQPAGTVVNGKIHYFGGGYPNSGSPVDDHHIYDPVSNTWNEAASLTAPRAIHYAASIDTTLYSLAGQGMTNLCQSYSSSTNSWTTLNNLPDNSFWYGAHVTSEGKIYRFCGGGFMAPTNKAHKYDPATDSWTSLPNMPNAIHALAGVAIGNQIFLSGGYFEFVEHDDVWIFDTETETYTASVPLPVGRDYHNMVALDSCIYSIGGNNAIDPTVKTSFIRLCPYDIVSSTIETDKNPKAIISYSSGQLVVQFSEPQNQITNLSVLDAMGRTVYQEDIPPLQDDVYVNLSDLVPAVYIVFLVNKNGRFSSKFYMY